MNETIVNIFHFIKNTFIYNLYERQNRDSQHSENLIQKMHWTKFQAQLLYRLKEYECQGWCQENV